MTSNAENQFNQARLRQKYAGGGGVAVVIGGRHGKGILSAVERRQNLEAGGFIQDVDAELTVMQRDFHAPAIGDVIQAAGRNYRVMSVADDFRMGEWVMTLQSKHR